MENNDLISSHSILVYPLFPLYYACLPYFAAGQRLSRWVGWTIYCPTLYSYIYVYVDYLLLPLFTTTITVPTTPTISTAPVVLWGRQITHFVLDSHHLVVKEGVGGREVVGNISQSVIGKGQLRLPAKKWPFPVLYEEVNYV